MLILLWSAVALSNSIAASEPIDAAARALITPAPRPIDIARRAASSSLGSETCGFISGNINNPLKCSSGYSCSSFFTPSYQFACCNDDGCIDNYSTCLTGYEAATASCYSDECLLCTGGNRFCGGYLKFASGIYSSTSYLSAFCTDREDRFITVKASPTNAPKSTVLCVPDGFAAPHTSDNCTKPIILLIPLILSNVIVFASSILMSRLSFQNKLKFGKTKKSPHDPWTPWAGLSTVLLVVVQAIATAALIRAGGYPASWTSLILLWLMRPRMQWAILLFYSSFGASYKRAATDALFANGLLNLLSLPTAAWLLQALLKEPSCTGFFNNSTTVNGFGNEDYTQLVFVGVVMYFSFAAVDLFVLVSFFWPGRLRLGRWWSIGAGLWSMASFAVAWTFWVWWVFFSEDAFCVTNIGPIAAIHAFVPFLSGVTRAYLT
ncbi:hypothetical protein BU24DRAFT_468569 [Aaosphaeria arxii CBS 175.79]|uniref:Uncharacterized protein n=1 Tax=Aaosphaeria arxii CBS 175.79 TaxID=1450172 RepID=A0A6A5X756_9PLEO|nr:uncharacterized protein BU24DRAFT_468569 [Aaosphaeria arxii CBS 175.79]KAF2008778.1 hypothetical protein BU24DRAFT_468569 [Aaosphaeria arxii CBS 175.79]